MKIGKVSSVEFNTNKGTALTNQMLLEDRQLREYLLGTGSADADEEIGLRIISDESFAEGLERAEFELTEDYLDGMLSSRETADFEANFLTSPERVRLLEEVRFMRGAVRQLEQQALRTDREDRKLLPKARFFLFRPPIFAAASLIVLFLAGVSVWFLAFRDGRSALELEYASLVRQDIADPEKTGGLYTINIIPANFRDTAATAAHRSAELTDRVVIRLALMEQAAAGTEFDVYLERSGRRVFTVPGRVFNNPFGSELRFMLPRSVMVPGNYDIVVQPAAGRSSGSRYYLRIE